MNQTTYHNSFRQLKGGYKALPVSFGPSTSSPVIQHVTFGVACSEPLHRYIRLIPVFYPEISVLDIVQYNTKDREKQDT